MEEENEFYNAESRSPVKIHNGRAFCFQYDSLLIKAVRKCKQVVHSLLYVACCPIPSMTASHCAENSDQILP